MYDSSAILNFDWNKLMPFYYLCTIKRYNE